MKLPFKTLKYKIRRLYWRLFSLKNGIYFSEEVQWFLFNAITKANIDLRQLHDLGQTSSLPVGWEVKGTEERYGRHSVLGFRLGYLVVPKIEEEVFCKALKEWIEDNLNTKIKTKHGLINIYMICHQLGFLIEERQYELSEPIKNKISSSYWEQLVRLYCDELNRNVKVEDSKLDCIGWDKLFLHVQYYDFDEGSLDLLMSLLYNTSISKIKILFELKGEIRAMYSPFSTNANSLSEQLHIKSAITSNPEEVQFLFAYLFQIHEAKPDWLTDEFMDELLTKYWKGNIGYVIRKSFDSNNLKRSSPCIDFIRTKLYHFLFTIHNEEAFNKELDWPYGWESIGIWLEQVYERGELDKIEDEFYKNSFRAYVAAVYNNAQFIFNYSPNKSSIIGKELQNIGTVSAKLVYVAFIKGFLATEDKEREEALTKLKNSLYLLKESVYGSYTVRYFALEVMDRIIYFYLSSSSLVDLSSDQMLKLKKIETLISKSFLHCYVKERETEDLFWDQKYKPNYYSNLALFYLNEILKENKPLINEFRDKINSFSAAEWGMKHTFVILGAGFSYHAGLPLANNIRDYFTRNNVDRILKFGSGESRWDDFTEEADLNNGKLGFDHLAYGYILNVLVKRFIDARGSFTNYEDMYQFFIDNFKVAGFISSVLDEAKTNCLNERPQLKDNPMVANYMYAFLHTDASHLSSLINHLIADLLFWRKKHEEFVHQYKNFLSFLANERNVTIVTLNHDLLLEFLLEKVAERPYSDGFTHDQKILFSSDGKPLNVFQNVFKESVSLLKLHGSLDIYKYDCYDENPDTSAVVATGDYFYFKTMNYYEKQHPERYDPISGKKVQTFHFEITPQFITGTNKPPLIASDKMYSALYKKLCTDIHSSESLLLIGYSYGDKHVNEQIELALKNGKLRKITNINPGMEFPYKRDGLEIVNLKDVSELVSPII